MKKMLVVLAALCVCGAWADAYVLKSVAVNTGYAWDEPSNWEGGVVPPDGADVVISNDVDNTTAGNNVCVTVLVSRAVSVNSIKFHEMPGAAKTTGHGARVVGTTAAAKLTIGAGGLELVPYPGGEVTNWESATLGGAPIFDIPIELAASQTWHIPHNSNNAETGHHTTFLNICGPLTAAAGIAWRVQGPGCIVFRENTTAGFLGSATFACDVTVADSRFGGDGSTVALVSGVEAFGGNAAGTLNPLMSYYGAGGLSVSQDIAFSTADAVAYFYTRAPAGYLMGDTEMTVSGNWSGNMRLTSDVALYFGSVYGEWSGVRAGNRRIPAMRKDAFKTVMRTDMSSIPTKGTAGAASRYPLMYVDNVIVVDGDNVLGAGNATRLSMRGRPVQGTVCGVLARNGRTVKSYISIVYRSIAGRTTEGIHYFGLDGPGECTFSGTISVGQNFPTGSRYCLTAPSNGVAQFTGKLTSVNFNPPLNHPPWHNEVCGRGTVRLSGTFEPNYTDFGVSRNDKSLLVRGGTLVLGNADAGGPHPQDLGAIVPKVIHVRACLDSYTFADVKSWSAGAYNFSTAAKTLATIDGVKLQDGDRVLVVSSVGNADRNGVYVVNSANKKWLRDEDLDTEAEFLPDIRVEVDEGERFAGEAFYLDLRDFDPDYSDFTCYLADGTSYQTNLWTKSGNYVKPFVLNSHVVPFHEESEANPRVSLLLEDGVTYTNTVNVWDNKSAGATTLGNWTNAAASCSFTGPIQLRRDVTLAANARSSVAFTGEFTALTDGGTTLGAAGAGLCDVTAATLDAKLALVFAGGTLKATRAQLAAARALGWREMDGAVGSFAVEGSCDLSGLSFDLSFTETADKSTTYVIGTASGGFSGAVSVSGLAKCWHLVVNGDSLEVRYWKPGLMFCIQ